MHLNNCSDSNTSDASMTCVLVVAGGIVWVYFSAFIDLIGVAKSPAGWQPQGILITEESIVDSVDNEGRRLSPKFSGNHWNKFSALIVFKPIISWTLLFSTNSFDFKRSIIIYNRTKV